MLKILDLFAGAGGLSLGFEGTNQFEVVAIVENNKNAAKTYLRNHPGLKNYEDILIGLKDNLGNTIIVEQVDGIETIYSNIDLLNYKLYDYVEKGELIGETINKNLILQFQKNGEYLDYKEII